MLIHFFMKYTHYVLIIAIIFSSIGLFQSQSTIANALTVDTSTTDIVSARIELKKPISLDTLLSAHGTNTLRGAILQSSIIIGGQELQEFYVVGADNTNIKDNYLKNRNLFIKNAKIGSQVSIADTQNIKNVLIGNITITDNQVRINEVKRGLDVSKVEILDRKVIAAGQTSKNSTKSREAHLVGDGGITTSAVAVTQPLYLSVPNSGISYFYPDAAGGRSVEQHMRWNTINFLSDQTYEHKVYLYNHERQTYLDGTSTAYPGCFPNTVYAVTNSPSTSYPYIDTRFPENGIGCEIDELSYTIGTAQASVLQPNIDYYTYMRFANGNDTVDKFKLQAQVGYRNPSTCYTTWCAAKYKIYTLIPSWSTAVPGTQSWTYSGQVPDAPSNVYINNPTASSLRVNFTDNTYDETNILVERKIGTSGSWILLGGFGVLPNVDNWNWTNSSLASGTTYCYRLRAINAVGSFAYSNESCGTTQ